MPIYEYQCKACDHTLDALQKLNDKPLKKCPECGKQQLKRLISAPSFRLKGGGWYETDFKSDKEKKRNIAGDKSSDSDSASSKKDTKKGDSKSSDKGTDKASSKPKKDSSSAVA